MRASRRTTTTTTRGLTLTTRARADQISRTKKKKKERIILPVRSVSSSSSRRRISPNCDSLCTICARTMADGRASERMRGELALLQRRLRLKLKLERRQRVRARTNALCTPAKPAAQSAEWPASSARPLNRSARRPQRTKWDGSLGAAAHLIIAFAFAFQAYNFSAAAAALAESCSGGESSSCSAEPTGAHQSFGVQFGQRKLPPPPLQWPAWGC